MIAPPPSVPSVAVRRATAADAGTFAAFAARAFRETYEPFEDPAELAHHLAHAFGPGAQAAELADPAITTLLAEVDGTLAGYAQLRQRPAPGCVTGPAPVELMRLYVDRLWHGRGVAAALMDEAERVARGGGARTVWMQVWEHNGRALAFYAKRGYAAVGHHPFVFGTAVEMDPVLVKRLG